MAEESNKDQEKTTPDQTEDTAKTNVDQPENEDLNQSDSTDTAPPKEKKRGRPAKTQEQKDAEAKAKADAKSKKEAEDAQAKAEKEAADAKAKADEEATKAQEQAKAKADAKTNVTHVLRDVNAFKKTSGRSGVYYVSDTPIQGRITVTKKQANFMVANDKRQFEILKLGDQRIPPKTLDDKKLEEAQQAISEKDKEIAELRAQLAKETAERSRG